MESGFFWPIDDFQSSITFLLLGPCASQGTIAKLRKTLKNPKKGGFFGPLKKWVPTPKNSLQGRPPNPIFRGGGG